MSQGNPLGYAHWLYTSMYTTDTCTHIVSIGDALVEVPYGVVWVRASELGCLVDRKVLDTLISLLEHARVPEVRKPVNEGERGKGRERGTHAIVYAEHCTTFLRSHLHNSIIGKGSSVANW